MVWKGWLTCIIHLDCSFLTFYFLVLFLRSEAIFEYAKLKLIKQKILIYGADGAYLKGELKDAWNKRRVTNYLSLEAPLWIRTAMIKQVLCSIRNVTLIHSTYLVTPAIQSKIQTACLLDMNSEHSRSSGWMVSLNPQVNSPLSIWFPPRSNTNSRNYNSYWNTKSNQRKSCNKWFC